MAEIGMSMEPPKKGFVEGVRKAFTLGGAKEQWYQDHAELVKKYADVNNGLSDEQRAQVMQKIDADASKAAGWNIARNYGATALVLTGLGTAGTLIARPDFAKRFAEAKFKVPFSKDKTFGTGKLGEKVFQGADWAHDGLAKVWTKAGELKTKAGEALKRVGNKKTVVEDPAANI